MRRWQRSLLASVAVGAFASGVFLNLGKNRALVFLETDFGKAFLFSPLFLLLLLLLLFRETRSQTLQEGTLTIY